MLRDVTLEAPSLTVCRRDTGGFVYGKRSHARITRTMRHGASGTYDEHLAGSPANDPAEAQHTAEKGLTVDFHDTKIITATMHYH